MPTNITIPIYYGKSVINVEVPRERTTIVSPSYPPSLGNEIEEIDNAINDPHGAKPLREIQKSGAKVSISICDVTRAQPREEMLKAIISNLPDINREDITLLIATGSHRNCTNDEIVDMLGKEIATKYRVVNHNAYDSSRLQYLGKSSNNVDVFLNKEWVNADLRITTGFVEPHFFAGFSGGPKMVAPGLAGIDTILDLHNFDRIAHKNSTWGITKNNPVHKDIRDIARMCPPDFSIDVTLNNKKEITRVFAGSLFQEHGLACEAAKKDAMQEVNSLFDIVLTSNSGFPLDQNLYQSVKGMAAAARVVKPNGTIICASECKDGLPNHGSYASLLKSQKTPSDLLLMIKNNNFVEPDQWQVQIQAQIQETTKIFLKNSYIQDSDVRKAHLEPISDINEAIDFSLNHYGSSSTLCVLPEGPQVIPYLKCPNNL